MTFTITWRTTDGKTHRLSKPMKFTSIKAMQEFSWRADANPEVVGLTFIPH